MATQTTTKGSVSIAQLNENGDVAGDLTTSTTKEPTSSVNATDSNSTTSNFLRRFSFAPSKNRHAGAPNIATGTQLKDANTANGQANGMEAVDGAGNEGHSGSSSMATTAKNKLSAFDRLKKLGGVGGKGKKDKEPGEFPPPSWQIDEETGLSSSSAKESQPVQDVTAAVREAMDESSLSTPPPPNPDSNAVTEKEVEDASASNSTPPNEAEPTMLARNIQFLLSSIPRVSFSVPSSPVPESAAKLSPPSTPPKLTETPQPAAGSASESVADRPPSPPPENFPQPNPTSAALIQDSTLISQLSSATIMNGSLSKGRESVWAILDRLGLSSRTGSGFSIKNGSSPKGKSKADPEKVNVDSDLKKVAKGDAEVPGSEDVMLYAPLEPDDASVVEVARSEVVEMSDDEGTVVDGGDSDNEKESAPVRKAANSKSIQKKDEPEAQPQQVKTKEAEKPKKEKVVWVPSTTKISVQVTWWGYRMCALSEVSCFLFASDLRYTYTITPS